LEYNDNYDTGVITITRTDRNGNKSYIKTDFFGNILKIVDALGYEANYIYDDNRNLIKIVDKNGNVSNRTFNDMKDTRGRFCCVSGNVISETIEGIGTTYYEYANDLLVKVIDVNGLETKLSYNANDYLEYSIDHDGKRTEYFYDSLGDTGGRFCCVDK